MRQRRRGIVDGGQRLGLGLHGLPALVVPDLLLGGFDLADRGGKLRRLVLELVESQRRDRPGPCRWPPGCRPP